MDSLTVLIIEDCQPDAELSIRQLQRSEFEVTADVVDNRQDALDRIQSKHYDIVLADYQLHGWKGIDVLELLKKQRLETPVILVTGAVGDQSAVDCIQRGAADYVLKSYLARLPQAVRSALEAKKLREQARQAEEEGLRLVTAIEQCAECVIITNARGTIEYVNPRFCEATGYTRKEVVGHNPRVLKSGFHPPAFFQEFWKTLAAGQTWHGEMVNRRKDGTLYTDELRVAPVRDASGRITHFISNQIDVTERRQIETERLLLATALAQTAEAVLITDPQGRIQFINSAFTTITGYAARDVIGKTPAILKSGRQDSRFYQQLWATILFGEVWRGEIVNRRQNGTLYIAELSITPVRDARGAISHFIAVNQDVTERKQAEETLKASEARYHGLFQASQDGLLLVDAHSGRIIDVNPAALRMLEDNPHRVLGRRLRELDAFRRAGEAPLLRDKCEMNLTLAQVRQADGRGTVGGGLPHRGEGGDAVQASRYHHPSTSRARGQSAQRSAGATHRRAHPGAREAQ
jgi:PAS domain S-box-containing protein